MGRRPGLMSFAAIVIFAIVATEAFLLATVVIAGSDVWSLGMDYRFYRDLGDRWLSDGTFYQPHQLSGPYDGQLMFDTFYPPTALLLFVPLVAAPAILWWVVPIVVLVYVLKQLDPAPWAWLVIALLLAFPRAIGAYLFGNSDIWAVAAVAAGIQWGWPAAFLVLKPIFLPFAFPAFRRRAFYLGLAALAAVSLAMLPLWFDYVTAMRGLRLQLDYSLGSIPLLAIPIVAWLGRRQPARDTAAQTEASINLDQEPAPDAAGNIQGAVDRP